MKEKVKKNGANDAVERRRKELQVNINKMCAAAISYAMCDIDDGEASAWWPYETMPFPKNDERLSNLKFARMWINKAIDMLEMYESMFSDKC